MSSTMSQHLVKTMKRTRTPIWAVYTVGFTLIGLLWLLLGFMAVSTHLGSKWCNLFGAAMVAIGGLGAALGSTEVLRIGRREKAPMDWRSGLMAASHALLATGGYFAALSAGIALNEE
ncbi:hypothetical protein [Arthrobacter sp. UYCu712]|uniref:hypothetical protein n=1 Tax=Arthrobacter sp. UYCu712 TaxID=3156340 RepID=UPI0033945856